MMIEIQQRPDYATRTPENSCKWIATADVGGNIYTAKSRKGAPYALARVLVAAGIEDHPVQVESNGTIRSLTTYPSLHEMARWTIAETVTRPARQMRWRDPAIESAQIAARKGSKQGVSALAGTPIAPRASGAMRRAPAVAFEDAAE
jgi:hypothetical protein